MFNLIFSLNPASFSKDFEWGIFGCGDDGS